MKFATVLIGLLFTIAGCQSMAKPSPGMANLRVQVIAEPKTGYQPPAGSSYYGPASVGTGDFERVDYSDLDDIVVWAEPASGTSGATPEPAIIEIDASKAAKGLSRAVSVGQKLIIRNRSLQPANFYSLSDGNEFDLFIIQSGGQAEYTIRAAGLIEILSDKNKESVAGVYAAPTRWVAQTRSNSFVIFKDLPPGLCRIISWHTRLPGSETNITLEPDQVASTTIKVGVNALPKISTR